MDYRLDFFNAVKKYQENSTEDDTLFIIACNSIGGDVILCLDGHVDILSLVLSDTNAYVKFKNKEQKLVYEESQKAVLDMAINILKTNKSLRKVFVSELESWKKD
jgi:23S rRNA U2552 (ribose-2'-O)-methylase RlmE/FtsJ